MPQKQAGSCPGSGDPEGGCVLTSSAGWKPATAIDPAIIRVATDLQIDLSDAFPKAVTREALQVADAVIVLGDAAPPAIGSPDATEAGVARVRTQRWNFPELRDEPDDVVRAALDELDVQVLRLLADLLATSGEPSPGHR